MPPVQVEKSGKQGWGIRGRLPDHVNVKDLKGSLKMATTDILAWINLGATGLLALVTLWYATSTYLLLKESRTTTAAAIEQAEAAKRQADATEKSIDLLRQQIEEQAGLGRAMVIQGIDAAARNIVWWKSENISNMAAMRTVPQGVTFIPDRADLIIQHALRISLEAASEIDEAFHNLKLAATKLEALRTSNDVLQTMKREGSQFSTLLGNAEKKLISAKDRIMRSPVQNLAAKGAPES